MQGNSHYMIFRSATSILDGFDDFDYLSMRYATLVTAGSPQTIPTPVSYDATTAACGTRTVVKLIRCREGPTNNS